MKKIPRCLISGCDGMLAEAIEKEFTDFDLVKTDKEEMDVRTCRKAVVTPSVDYIIHLAALTDLEYCQTHPRHAYYTNTIGTFNMVEIAKEYDIPIIYISTAGVFHGEDTAFNEHSKPNPVNTYGQSKYYGEIAVQAHPKHYIFRLSWAFGGGSRDRKFVMKICKLIREGVRELYAVTDKSGSPTYTRDVAKIIHQFITEKKPYGLYHIPTGVATRFQVAQEIVRLLAAPVKVVEANSSYFLDYTAIRPKCEVLESLKGVTARDWREALREYLDELALNKS